jgi:uncharacterized protein (DUF58 family)
MIGPAGPSPTGTPSTLGLRFDGEFLRKLEFLRIVSRKAFAGRDRADRIARARGRGAEFADYRPYVAGDDVRQIDWKAYKRLNKLLLRLFDEERDLPIYLFLDASGSMALSGKFDLARRVAAALCYIGLVHLDRVTVASFSTEMAPEIVPGRGRSRIFALLDRLDALEPAGGTDLFRTIRGFAARSRPRGVAVVISDFLDPAGVEPSLRMLSALGHDVFVLHVQASHDGDVRPLGEVRIVDVESGETRDVDLTPSLVASYRAAWARQVAALNEVCGRYRLTYLPARVDDPFEDVVLRAFRAGGFLE